MNETIETDAPGIPQYTPPRNRRRVLTVTAVIAGLILLAGLGILSSFFIRYHLADMAADRGDHAQAYEMFTALNGFMDSPERAVEQHDMICYAQAAELYRQEKFLDAYHMFRELGDFQDSARRAETAWHMSIAAASYDAAMDYYDKTDFDSLVRSYACFEEITVENFRDTEERMASILERLGNLAADYADQGYCYKVPEVLDLLARKEYAGTEELRAEIAAREHIEPDDSYYNMDLSRISSFSGTTTREEFFTLWRYMYLTGTTTLYIPAARSGAVSASYVDPVLDRVDNGYYLSQIILPEYPSIYDWYEEVWWVDNWMTHLDLYIKWDGSYTAGELAAHMETLDRFCRESIRILNENLLLGASMSNQQKARVIYDWVCFYLTYDQTKEIHDAAIAVEGRLGVCESYVAIYARMCNLAGVRTYGQPGITDNRVGDETHIWTVQEDENGNLFYTDPTWGDNSDYLTMTYEWETNDPYAAFCTDYEDRTWSSDAYFWQTELFGSHTPRFEFPYEWVKSVTSG